MVDLKSFVNSFPENSAEREYHEALRRIVSPIAFDKLNPYVGLGLVGFLTYHRFIGGGIDTGTHSVAGSREEDTLFVAHLFHELGHEPRWWRHNSLTYDNPREVENWCNWWWTQFEQSSLVERVW
jgi:hypothetical protein